MSLIKCPECGKEISDKAIACPNCGCPSSEWQGKKLEVSRKYDNDEKAKLIKELCGRTGCDPSEAKEIAESYIKSHGDEIYRIETEQQKEISKIFCPYCNSESIDNDGYCAECGMKILQYSKNAGSNCGFQSSERNIENEASKWEENVHGENNEGKNIEKIILDVLRKYDKTEKVKMIKELRERTGYSLKESKEIVEGYINSQNKVLPHAESKAELKTAGEKPPFHGIYKYSLFGGKTEVYCPRCGSENCSYYQEQKIIPGKTKTKYTANLNPLKPFTLVNKKEKVVKKEKAVTETKIMCNDCGWTFC